MGHLPLTDADAAPAGASGYFTRVMAPWRRGDYVVPMAVAGAWMVLAYIRLRPTPAMTAGPRLLASYGRTAWGRLAYSDVLSLYHVHHLADHATPYVHTVVEYPVVTGLFMWLAAWAPGVQGYFLVSAIGLTICALGCVHLLYRQSPRAALAFAVSPLLLVYGMLNWDLLGIALMLLGWTAFRAHRYTWAGVLLSLAVFAKLFPVVLLFYCLVSLLGDQRERAGAATLAAAAAGTAVVLNVPFLLANFHGWSDFFRFNASRSGGGGLLYEFHIATNWPISRVDAVTGVLVGAVLVALVPRVRAGRSPAAAAALGFAAFMLLNKVFSPQYMLWVFSFGVLAAWPMWTLAVVSVAGLVDYVDAMIALHLSSERSAAFAWYFRKVFPLNKMLRLGSIAVAAVASLWAGRRGASGEPVALTTGSGWPRAASLRPRGGWQHAGPPGSARAAMERANDGSGTDTSATAL